MPICPNCYYKLVFLQKRLKYKCAKCGKIFLQKFIENRDFQRWNKFQRQMDKNQFVENFKKQWLKYKKQFQKPKLSSEEKKLKVREYSKKWQIKNKNKCRKACRRYYEKNREKILDCKKLYNKTARDKIKSTKRDYRLKNIERTRLLARIGRWRVEQGKLVQQKLKEDVIRFPLLVFRKN